MDNKDQNLDEDKPTNLLPKSKPYTPITYLDQKWVKENLPEFNRPAELDQDDKSFIEQIKVRGIVGGISIA